MPLGRISVRGGRRLQRFLMNFQSLSQERVAELLAAIIERVVIPRLRSAAPRRTGRLQRSIRADARNGKVEIRAVFYGRFQRIEGRTLAETALDIVMRERPLIRAELRQAIRRELGVVG